MKKCLIIFTIAILSIIPISKASASVTYNGVEYPDLPTSNKTDYYTIANTHRGTTLIYYPSDLIKDYGSGLGYSTLSYDGNSSSWGASSSSEYRSYISIGGYETAFSSNNVYIYILNDNSWKYLNYGSYGAKVSSENVNYTISELKNNPELFKDVIGDNIIYSNISYYVNINSTNYYIYTYTPKEINKEYLAYSANKANDLDGIDIYNFRFNANNYNSRYKYLIKTEQQTEWTDITEELNNEANQYDYMLYYNTTLYMQVLDENNEVLETKTHQITDLTEYSFKITHAAANDLNDRYINVITIDTRYIYEMDHKYQYSFDNQVFYDMEITEDNKIYYLNHALDIPVYFRVLNAGNRAIHEQVYNGDFSNVEKNVIFYESTNISNNEKQIIIQVDFTEYLKFFDMYNFRIWVDSVEYDEQTFIKEFISTEENYIKSIKIKIQVDNLTIEDFTYRVGTETGTSGGSDTDFDNMYDTILDNQLKNELKENDYTTVNGMVQAIKNFINAISEFVTVFFELIMYFFNKLNIWIRTCIISLFIELVIFKTIKAVRKK